MFGKQAPQPASPETVAACAHALYEAIARALTNDKGVRVEDFIVAAATIVGEACIAAAGDYNPRDHKFPPGQRVLSTKANDLISGDAGDIRQAPETSIAGLLYFKLTRCGFVAEDFPPLTDVYRHFAAHVGKAEDWGKVPLSVADQHHPLILPLRIAYQSRGTVDQCLAPLADNRHQRLVATTLTLAEVLCATRDVLARKTATTLALETLNGMAKTAPMTPAAMAEMSKPKP